LVHDYGVGYVKMDYNVDSLQGTDQKRIVSDRACSTTTRAAAWLEGLLKRYPALVIENCGSGGGRMDYAMLSVSRFSP